MSGGSKMNDLNLFVFSNYHKQYLKRSISYEMI